jgi:hypothetical protein
MNYIGGVIFAAFVCGALVATAILRPRQSDYDYKKNRDYSRYPTANNTDDVTSLIAIAEEIQQSRQESQNAESDKRFRDLATIGGIGLYTLITAGIAGISWYQAQIFKETEIRQLRAYVSLDIMTIQCCRKRNDPPTVKQDNIGMPLTNDGQTPAYYLYSFLSRLILTPEEIFPNGFQCVSEKPILEKERFGGIINPKKNFISYFEVDGSLANEIQDAKEKNSWMIFWGIAYYNDIFKDTYAQNFCYQYENPATPETEIGLCPTGNKEEEVSYRTLIEPPTVQRRSPIYVPEVPQFKM